MSVDSGKGWITPAGDRADLDGLHQEALMRVLHSPAAFGQLVTRSFGFTGSRLHLNCATTPVAAGPGPAEVRVEVLTSNHRKIEGFTFDDADPITQSGQDHVVSWNGNPDVSRLTGRPIKLRFYFKNAKLYSFQFRTPH